MKMYDFIIVNADTDSISFCKKDQSEFTEPEQKDLINEINDLLPEKIKFAHDGYFKKVLVIKAKNYVLKTFDGKIKIKGSAMLATMKCQALRTFIKEVINLLLEDDKQGVVNLYNDYVTRILKITDIRPWATRKTVTNSVLNPERTNEQKILDAIQNDNYQEGDKLLVYFCPDGSLKQAKDWNHDHCPYKLLENLYKTILVFSPVIDKKLFINYSLKTKRKLLCIL